MRGRFITLEGGEGAGKSTQITALKDRIANRFGVSVVTTREPGGTPGAEGIRSLLVTGEVDRWDGIEETLLLFAARRQHVRGVIQPALDRGDWVLCDRFTDSTRVYQGIARGVDRELIETVKQAAIGDLEPDTTFFLDLDAETGLKRTVGRHGGEERFEQLDIAFHTSLRHGFVELAQQEPRIHYINAALDPATVTGQIMDVLADLYATQPGEEQP